ncbi:MAG: hypothetical protein ACLQDV_01195 [Candidatus Binataceae bacterium]
MSIRSIAAALGESEEQPYFKFNREERQLSAVLFFLLNQRGNVTRLVKNLASGWPLSDPVEDHPDFGIYVEYSLLRDFWKKLEHSRESSTVDQINERKKKVILGLLRENKVGAATLKELCAIRSWKEFNGHFVKRASEKFIQSPSTWNLSQLRGNFKNKEELTAALQIKWAFKIKPDIVIHTDRDHAICLELKLESAEGTYGNNEDGFKVRQLEMQDFLMKQMLGLKEYRCVFVSPRVKDQSNSENERQCRKISWTDLLEMATGQPYSKLTDRVPAYMRAALDYARKLEGLARPHQ